MILIILATAVVLALLVVVALARQRWDSDTRPTQSQATGRAPATNVPAAPETGPQTVHFHIGHVDQFIADGGQGAYLRAGVPLEDPATQSARVVDIRPARAAKALEGPR